MRFQLGLRSLTIAFAAVLAASSPVMSAPTPALSGGVSTSETAQPPPESAGGPPKCETSNTAAYDKMYGTKGVVLTQDQADAEEGKGNVYRCGGCGYEEMCWLKSGANSDTPVIASAPLQGGAQQTYNHGDNGASGPGHSYYPSPVMVGTPQQQGGASQSGGASAGAPANSGPPVDTVWSSIPGYGTAKAIAPIPRNWPLKVVTNVNLEKDPKSNSPFTTAKIELLTRKTARTEGQMEFLSVSDGRQTIPLNVKVRF